MLTSKLFRSDAKLQACATGPAFHIALGASGPHVSRIHLALLILGYGGIDGREWRARQYGVSTAATVLSYKQSRAIINRAYQQQADDVVGVLTVTRLDAELCGIDQAAHAIPTRLSKPGLHDTASQFEFRRCLSQLALQAVGSRGFRIAASTSGKEPSDGPNPDPATVGTIVAAFTDLAGEFNSLLGSAVLQPGAARPDAQMIPPMRGGIRWDICQAAAEVAARDEGLRFDQTPHCWNITDSKDKPPSPMDKQWCGFYAAYVLSLGGVRGLSWQLNGRGLHSKGKKVPTSYTLNMLAPGDILLDERALVRDGKPVVDKDNRPVHLVHHMLILQVSANRKTAEILQGNSGKGTADRSIVTRVKNHPLPTEYGTHSFFSVDTLRNPSTTYHGH